eukprot:g21421.t1
MTVGVMAGGYLMNGVAKRNVADKEKYDSDPSKYPNLAHLKDLEHPLIDQQRTCDAEHALGTSSLSSALSKRCQWCDTKRHDKFEHIYVDAPNRAGTCCSVVDFG